MSENRVRIPKAFSPLFKPKRYKIYYGGRGGAKSWNFARVLLILGTQKKLRILCTREFQSSIQDSVHRLLSDQIEKLKLSSFYTINQRDIRGSNGTLILFEGLYRNVHRIKSLEGIDICWVEEAAKVTEFSWEILIPTIRKKNSEIWASFNPDQEDDPVYKRFVDNTRDDAIVKMVSHKDNPYFPDTLRKELEWDKKVDFDKYLHVWEGKCRSHSDAQVFKGKYRVAGFAEPKDKKGKLLVDVFRFGADWGFSQDPSVAIKCYEYGNSLYITHEAYAVGVDIDKLPELFDSVPDMRQWPSIADSSRPDTISYMRNHGYPKMIGAKKGKGSIEDGVSYIRSYEEVVIHERCKRTAVEFGLYSYKVDPKTEQVLPVIVDKNNHCIDSIRYALEPVMRTAKAKSSSFSARDLGL